MSLITRVKTNLIPCKSKVNNKHFFRKTGLIIQGNTIIISPCEVLSTWGIWGKK